MALKHLVLRSTSRLTAVLLAGTALFAAANAQTLQRLTISQFTLSADTNSPKLEAPFHLIVSVHVKQPVTFIDNMVLPVLADLEVLGDERRVTRDSTGTTYREAIAVVAHHTGQIHLAPVTLDAIDPRDNRAKRYFSNDLTLTVTGGAMQPLREAGSVAKTILRAIFILIFWTICALAAIFVAVTIYRRRRVPVPPPPIIDPPLVERLHDPRELLRDGLLTLRAEPTRYSAVQVRSLARALVGASDSETLSDVLRRPAANDVRVRDVLRSLERAAFTYDSDLPAAIEAAIISLEHALA